jgi:hypothetical protein
MGTAAAVVGCGTGGRDGGDTVEGGGGGEAGGGGGPGELGGGGTGGGGDAGETVMSLDVLLALPRALWTCSVTT